MTSKELYDKFLVYLKTKNYYLFDYFKKSKIEINFEDIKKIETYLTDFNDKISNLENEFINNDLDKIRILSEILRYFDYNNIIITNNDELNLKTFEILDSFLMLNYENEKLKYFKD